MKEKKMKDKKKICIYSILLLIGLLSFILHVFVFETPNGFLGLIVCIISIELIIGSIIKLCKLNQKIKDIILGILDALFFWT